MSGINWICGRSYNNAFVLINANTPGPTYHMYLTETPTLRACLRQSSSKQHTAPTAATLGTWIHSFFHCFCCRIDWAAWINEHRALRPCRSRVDRYGSSVSEAAFESSSRRTRSYRQLKQSSPSDSELLPVILRLRRRCAQLSAGRVCSRRARARLSGDGVELRQRRWAALPSLTRRSAMVLLLVGRWQRCGGAHCREILDVFPGRGRTHSSPQWSQCVAGGA